MIATRRLDLILLDLPTLDALLSGRASSIDGVALPPSWVGDSERVLRRRLEQATRDPQRAAWLLRSMVRREDRRFVGRIGFHGEPGVNALGARDAAELGYTVEPSFRRQGFAEEAIRGMIEWAGTQSISRFLLSISPENAPSLALAAKLGFVEIARVFDDEDGPETVFELRT